MTPALNTQEYIQMLNNSIVPGKSIGGIHLGENIIDVMYKLEDDHLFEQTNHNTIVVDAGTVTIFHDAETGVITAISCNQNFKGNFMNKLWPGMSVKDVLENSRHQIAWCGFVEIDKFRGIGLSLPAKYDDFERITDFLTPDFIFEELWVYGH